MSFCFPFVIKYNVHLSPVSLEFCVVSMTLTFVFLGKQRCACVLFHAVKYYLLMLFYSKVLHHNVAASELGCTT